jgi:5-methylcytosine-specific restriction endonuclease McrA
VKLAAFERAGGHCEKCTARLYAGKFHYDHVLPDWLGGTPTLENCAVLCVACHGEKTTQEDRPRIDKAKRQRAKHLGVRRPSSFRKLPPGYRYDWKQRRAVRTDD